MKTLIHIAAFLFTIPAFAQTKLIAYRSHSGSTVNFHTAVERELFDMPSSNLGIVTTYVYKIDTVILKGNNRIIVIRNTYYSYGNKLQKSSSARDTLTRANAADYFKVNSIADLKTQLHKTYKTSLIDSTRFLGFDKKFRQSKSLNNR